MNFNEFTARLKNVKGGGNSVSARCPAHDDGNNSLVVSKGNNGNIVLHCHAGCTTEEVCNAMGLKLSDLYEEPPTRSKPTEEKPHIENQYDYYDEGGSFLFRKTKWVTDSGKKSFTWSHKDKEGKWQKGRGGEPALFNLYEASGNEHIYLVEGEKDVETMSFLGLPTVSTPDGAGSKWQPQFTEFFIGKTVTIVQDNDTPGKKHAQKCAAAIYGKASAVKVIDLTKEWPELKEHGDITDVYDLMCKNSQGDDFVPRFLALEQATPFYDPAADEPAIDEETDPELEDIFSATKALTLFEESEIEWLIPGWLPREQITCFAGDGGTGKTSVWVNVVAALSSGHKCVFDPEDVEIKRPPMKVLILTTEDSISHTLLRQLRVSGANLDNIHTVDFLADKKGILNKLKFGSPQMNALIRRFKPDLCVFDPIQGFLPRGLNMGSRNDMRDCLQQFIPLGEECGTTTILICHTNKRTGASGRNRIADSADVWDISRSVMLFGYSDKEGVRYISHEKSNYSKTQQTILFTLDDDKQPTAVGRTWKKDHDFVQAQNIAKSPTTVDECKDMILQLLNDNDGELLSNELETQLKSLGYSRSTINRAKKPLKEENQIRYISTGFGSDKTWTIKRVYPEGWNDYQDVENTDLSSLPFPPEPLSEQIKIPS